jgi:hypothetical protein
MSNSVILGRVGAHVLDQLERALGPIEGPGASGWLGVWLRTVEVAIPFATSDGTSVSSSTIVVGETPIFPANARELLLPLVQRVLVRAADLEHAPPASRGLLVLRVLLPQPAATTPTINDQAT